MTWAQRRIRVGGVTYEQFLVASDYRPTQTSRRGCLYCWGRGNDAATLTQRLYWRGTQYEVAREGIPVYSSDYVSSTHWGNQAAIDEMTVARTNMAAAVGGKTDKVLLLAVSLGAALALNWARQNPTAVAAVALITPAVDLENIRTTTGHTAEIEASYGGLAAFTAARPTHNPVEYASELDEIPIKVWYSTNDTTCAPATVEAFASAAGAELVSLGAVGHSAGLLNRRDVAEFLAAYAV